MYFIYRIHEQTFMYICMYIKYELLKVVFIMSSIPVAKRLQIDF